MSNRIRQLTLVTVTICLSGCAMCANPFDCQYAAYGSRLPRADMTYGRVGSILDGGGQGVVTTEAMEGFPIDNGGMVFDGSYSQGEVYGGEVYNEGEVIYGGSQSFQNAPSASSGVTPLYESPSAPGASSGSPLPATDQINRVYEAIDGEINK